MTDYEKILAEEYRISKDEAIVNVAVVTGFSPDYIRNSMKNLIASKMSADEVLAKIKALSKVMTEPKRPVSPYAKFDTYHRKKKRR